MKGVSVWVGVSVSSGVSVLDGVIVFEGVIDGVSELEGLALGVTELVYDVELVVDGCRPTESVEVGVAVCDAVLDDVREERIEREVVGVPVAFGVTERVGDSAGQFIIAYTLPPPPPPPPPEYRIHAPDTNELFRGGDTH